MNPQVTAALISGIAALAVALLGIAGAIAAQLLATKRAFANSLVLLERQFAQSLAAAEQERAERERVAQQERADREREREEQLRREDAYRYSEQRRSIYARFLRAAADTRWSHWVLLHDDGLNEKDEQARQERSDYQVKRAKECSDRLLEVSAELRVIASSEVFAAAMKVLDAVPKWDGRDHQSQPGREAFLLAVRRELGVDELQP
jgi:hypothetical protein